MIADGAPPILTSPINAAPPSPTTIAELAVLIDALTGEERHADARAVLTATPGDGWDATAGARRALRAAELDAADGRDDEAILQLQALDVARLGDEAPRRAVLLASLYGRKRCRGLATAALAAATAAHPDAWQVALAAGDIALGFDDRDLAARHYALARGQGGGVRAAVASARLAFVLGDFAQAHAILAEVTPCQLAAAPPADGTGIDDTRTPGERALVARLEAALASAAGDHASEARAWRAVMAAAPRSDRRATAALNLGFALASAGDRATARAELEACWRAYPEHGAGKYANSRAELLARAPADARRHALPFPSTHQKYEFCGPAVLELCLRALGIELSQDEIAADVKRERGTPMYDIVRFLGRREIAARRVVATADKVRAAIDLGLPLIIQEEYSTTSHVAVIMGYDAALEVFLVRDPMTHQLSTRPWGWTESAGWLYGSGAVLVVGRLADPRTADALAACDAAGLVDAAHLALCDDISRRRSGRAGAEAATPQETLELTSRALAVDDNFGLAWMHRFSAYAALAAGDRDRWGEAALDCLVDIRERFPFDEWPWQAHGRWLMSQGAYAESFAAYLAAHRADPDDGNNLAWMGYCRQRERRLAAAERHLLAALRAEGDLGLREGVLAETYLYALEQAERDADTAGAAPAGISPGTAAPVETLERDPAELVRRGRHFAAIATELLPHQRYYWELRGLLAIRAGDADDARAAFGRARDGQPDRFFAVLGLAHVTATAGDRDGALAIYADACRFARGDAEPWLRRAALLVRGDAHAEAATVLEEGLALVSTGRERFVDPLWDALARLGSHEEAAARLRERAFRHHDDADLLLAAASKLDREGQRGHAVALLRAVLSGGPDNLAAMVRLGRILGDSALTRGEGRALLAAAVAAAPDWTFARRSLAMAWADEDPAKGLEILTPALGEDDLYVNEAHALLLEATGELDRAERVVRRVIAAYDGPEVEALTRMCSWNWSDRRYQRALSWARRLRALPLGPDDDADDVLDTWVTAYRLAGQTAEVIDELRARCADGVPAVAAREVYWATSHHDRALAARAAQVVADGAAEPGERLEWRIEAAKMRGLAGETEAVRALWGEAEALASAGGWANLSWGLGRLKQYADADRAAAAAIAVDPDDLDAVTAALEAAMRAGDPGAALGFAHHLVERHPFDHRGPERLAELYAKTLDPERAVSHGAAAIEAAPYCGMAHGYGALAYLIAGERELARRHAEQALRLAPPDEADAYDAALLVVRALQGDAPGLDRCLAASTDAGAGFAGFFARLRAIAAGA